MGCDVVSREEKRQVAVSLIGGVGFGLLTSMVEAEARMGAGERHTATAAVGKGEGTQGRAVQWANRGLGCLLGVEFYLKERARPELAVPQTKRAGLKPGTYNFDSKQEHRQECPSRLRASLCYQKRKASREARHNAIQKNYTGVVIESSNRKCGTPTLATDKFARDGPPTNATHSPLEGPAARALVLALE